MIFELYSIKDELGDYAPPIPFKDCATAKRYFRTQLETNEFMKSNKNDFSLWYMGLFNAEKGTITESMCELVERGFSNGNEKVVLPDTD